MMNARNIKLGAYGGLAGGVVFGAMLGMMGMLPMIGKLVRHPSAVTAFLVPLVMSALIGASFVIFFHRFVHGASSELGYGLVYGGAWWFAGPLTLMPLMMGMGLGVNWNAGALSQIIYGAILGLIYAWLRKRTTAHERVTATPVQRRSRALVTTAIEAKGLADLVVSVLCHIFAHLGIKKLAPCRTH